MVSSATAVLPVWRSPMISSRCPRPIGIMLSMAFSPVVIGSRTRLAVDDAGSKSLDWDNPRCFDRPLVVNRLAERVHHAADHSVADTARSGSCPNASPDRLREARCSRPAAPSRLRSLPRFMARPATPCGNSISSPYMTFSRPWMRAIPSPREMIVPTSSTCIFGVVVLNLLTQQLCDFVCLDLSHLTFPTRSCVSVRLGQVRVCLIAAYADSAFVQPAISSSFMRSRRPAHRTVVDGAANRAPPRRQSGHCPLDKRARTRVPASRADLLLHLMALIGIKRPGGDDLYFRDALPPVYFRFETGHNLFDELIRSCRDSTAMKVPAPRGSAAVAAPECRSPGPAHRSQGGIEER